MKISIIKHTQYNSVSIYIPKQILSYMKNNSVCVKIVNNVMYIREAIISDKRTFKISKNSAFTYTKINAPDLIGEYNFEIENENIVIDL